MSEIVEAEQWLYSTLSGDSTLTGLATGGVWRVLAPAKTALPYVIFQKQAARDVSTVAAIRIMDSLLYTVKAVVLKSDYLAKGAAMADRIDTLLHRQTATTSNAYVFACYREEPFSMDELTAGTEYSHLGGIYRLYVQSK